MRENPTPHVNGKYGAPMGRQSDNLSALAPLPAEKFTLQKIRLDSGGYDSGGAYWGIGTPLYWWSVTIREEDTVEECSGFLRARDRVAAKAAVRALHPDAQFYR